MSTTAIGNAQTGFSGQSARFMQVKFNDVVVGGAQSVRWSEHTGVRDYVGEIGSDHKEPDFDKRQVSGTIERLTLNKRKIRDLFAGGDSSAIDLDFRQFVITMSAVYQGNYSDFKGHNSGTAPLDNKGNPMGTYVETINQVMFQDISGSVGGPYELIRESVSFMGTSVGAVADSEVQLG